MKNARLYAKRTAKLILWLYIGQIISHGAVWILNNLYLLLHKYFSDAFPLFSPIKNAEEYKLFSAWLSIAGFLIGMFFAIYLSVLFENSRYEHIITKTDGLYDIPDALSLYTERYLRSDIIGSAIATVTLTLPGILIPAPFFTKDYSFLLSFSRVWYEALGPVLPSIIIVILISLYHIPAAMLSLSKWRANWLAGFAA